MERLRDSRLSFCAFFSSQGQYDNFNFKIASSPDAAEAYSSVFADFHPIREEEDKDVEWRINRREAAAAAAAQSGRGDYVEGSGGDYNYNDLSFEDYEKASSGWDLLDVIQI